MLIGNRVTLSALILPSILAFVLFIYYVRTNYNVSKILSRVTAGSLDSCDDTAEISASSVQNDRRNSRYRRVINGDVEWSELQQFFMQTVNDNCTVLATPDTEQLLGGQYQHHISKHGDKLKTIAKSSIEGNSVTSHSQTILYLLLSRQKWVENICEIGFNAGHSAIAWLAGSNKTRLFSFDIALHDYVRPMADYIASQFPGRFSIAFGDSKVTVPKFINEKNGKFSCDILIVDGDHSYEGALADLKNMRSLAKQNGRNILILDDFPSTYAPFMQMIGAAWIDNRKNDIVGNIFNCVDYSSRIQSHGLTLGYYIK